MFLFVDDIIIYVENPKELMKNLLELISDYSKVAGYKVNIKKSIVFPYARNCTDLTEAEDIKKRWQEYIEELHKKDLIDPDNHNGVITHLEPDILECEVEQALRSITTNKASGGDGIPVQLFQILKDDGVKVLYSICQQVYKT